MLWCGGIVSYVKLQSECASLARPYRSPFGVKGAKAGAALFALTLVRRRRRREGGQLASWLSRNRDAEKIGMCRAHGALFS